MEKLKQSLISICELTKLPLAQCINDDLYHLLSGELIPQEHIDTRNKTNPLPDGFYFLSEITCDNYKGCKIGERLQGCSVFKEGYCARYQVYTLDSQYANTGIKLKDVLTLLGVK